MHGDEERDDELFLVVAADPRHLRSVRLVVADAGRRAGFTVSEIDDLRLAVDELTQALVDATEHRIVIRVAVRDTRVVVRGTARRRRSDPPPRLRGAAALIVEAVCDHHDLDHAHHEMWFTLAKSGAEAMVP